MTYIKIIKVCPGGPVDAAAIIVICIAIINQSILRRQLLAYTSDVHLDSSTEDL